MKKNRKKEQGGFRTGKCLVLCSVVLTAILLHLVSPLTYAATSFSVTNLTANNPVTAGYTRFGNIQLNDAGQAVFTGVNPSIADSQGRPRVDVFFWDGTTLRNITANIPGFVVSGGSINLNQKGQIVFVGFTDFFFFRNFPFFYNGTSFKTWQTACRLLLEQMSSARL